MRLPLLKHSGGRESVSFTMMVVGFSIVSLWLLVSITESIFGIQIREFSSSESMAYLTPLFVLYFSRRWKEKSDADENDFNLPIDETEMGK